MKKLVVLLVFFCQNYYGQNWQPVYELINANIMDHFYTMNTFEVTQAENNMGYVNQGIVYYWSSQPYNGGIGIYRLWNNSDHFYTTSETEKNNLLSRGYSNDGIVGYLNSQPKSGLVGWCRYYNSGFDDHAYLLETDIDNINQLLWNNYQFEGIHGYVLADPFVDNQPPNAEWNSSLLNEYNYGEDLNFSWLAADDQTASADLKFTIELEGDGGFTEFSNMSFITFLPKPGWHRLTITTCDEYGDCDPSPLIHEFSVRGGPPDRPYNLQAILNNNNDVELSWQSSDQSITEFFIIRDYNNNLAGVDKNKKSYIDYNVSTGNTYRYTIRASNEYEFSESEPVYITVNNTETVVNLIDWPVGYPDFGGWYDAQCFGSILAIDNKHHSGNDLNKLNGNDLGADIYAPADGTIVYKVKGANGWGNCLVLKCEAGADMFFIYPDGSIRDYVYFMMAHLGDINLYTSNGIIDYDQIVLGQTKVSRGDKIATIGEYPGGSPHLHLECWSEFNQTNPLGNGYYQDLPIYKYDALEFIKNNRIFGQNFSIYCHNYNNEQSELTFFYRLTNNWQQKTGYSEQVLTKLGYNNNLYISQTDKTAIARWYWSVPISGEYDLSVYIPSQYYSSSHAIYTLYRQNFNSIDISISNFTGTGWVNFGKYQFIESVKHCLELKGKTDESPIGWLAADAVKLTYYQGIGGLTNIEHQKVLSDNNIINCYPNPFNAQVNIFFKITNNANVKLSIYNILGQQTNLLIDDYLAAGDYHYKWWGMSQDGLAVASGVYLTRLVVNDKAYVMKILYLK